MSDNKAAFRDNYDRKLRVADAEDQFANEDEIVIKNAAISLNPVDKDAESLGDKFPQIPGADVAGEVIEAGIDVEKFQVGDRVLGHALVLGTRDNRHGAFQSYTVVQENMAARIPKDLPFNRAAAIPLGLSTAAAALFQKDFLNLSLPTVPRSTIPDPAETVIIFGATGNVGSNAVQLAIAAGYKVVGTADGRNPSTLEKIEALGPPGTVKAVDDRGQGEEDILNGVKAAFMGRKLAGVFDTVAIDSTLRRAVNFANEFDGKKMAVCTGSFWGVETPKGVTTRDVMAVAIRNNDVGKEVYRYISRALNAKEYKIMDTVDAGTGLESIQSALDDKARGKKVITLN